MGGRYAPSAAVYIREGKRNLLVFIKGRWRNLIIDTDLCPGGDLETQDHNKGIKKVSHNFLGLKIVLNI